MCYSLFRLFSRVALSAMSQSTIANNLRASLRLRAPGVQRWGRAWLSRMSIGGTRPEERFKRQATPWISGTRADNSKSALTRRGEQLPTAHLQGR